MWVEPGAITCSPYSGFTGWWVAKTLGEGSLEYVLPIVRDKLGDMLRAGAIDIVGAHDALLAFVGEWSSATEEVATAYLMLAFANNTRIVRHQEAVAMIEQAQRKGARPVQGGRAPGTRKARRKRKHARGRR